MTSTELVSELQAYVDACSGITLYDGHPAVLIAKARDAITTLERELDEAQLAASVIEGTCNEMDLELTASQAQIERLKEALAYIARGYSGEVGVNAEGHSGTHCAEIARAALQVEESKG